MSIKSKLYFALGLVFIVVITVMASALYNNMGNQRLKSNVRDFQSAKTAMMQAKEMQLEVAKVWQFITDASLTKDHKVIDEEAKSSYDKALAIVAQLQSQGGKDAADDLNKLKSSLPAMWQVGEKMFQAYQEDWNKGNIVMEEFDKVCDEAIKNVEGTISTNERNTSRLEKEMAEQLNNQQQGSFISSLITLAIAIALCILMIALVRSIGGALSRLTDAITDVAQGEGDLTKRLDANGNDEIALISRMFNQFIDKLHGIISQISSTSTQVAAASSQLHSTAEQIATGAEEVAAQAGTVATAGEEMSATSGDIAQNCQMAVEGAQRASHAATNGADVARHTIEGIIARGAKTRENAVIIESLGARSDQI
jgi:methyl-accepting chemotaxis protein